MNTPNNQNHNESASVSDVVILHQSCTNLMSLETQSFWQVTTTHLLALTILSAVAAGSDNFLVCAAASFVGLIVAYYWQLSAYRSNEWHRLYLAQVRQIESKLPENYEIYQMVTNVSNKDPSSTSIRTNVDRLPLAFSVFFNFLIAIRIAEDVGVLNGVLVIK